MGSKLLEMYFILDLNCIVFSCHYIAYLTLI